MTNAGPEPPPKETGQYTAPSGVVYNGPPQPPRLAHANPRSGRQLGMIMLTIVVFLAVLVALAIWAAGRG